jgi:hypothetical protein
MEFP